MDHYGGFRIEDGDPSLYDGVAYFTNDEGEEFIAVSANYGVPTPEQIYRITSVETEFVPGEEAACNLFRPDEPCVHKVRGQDQEVVCPES